MDIVKEAGTGFAVPSQTAYLSRDSGLDAAQGKRAETKVRKWRADGQLPFPDFDEAVSQEQEDSLDYPPEGSPGYEPRDAEPETKPAPRPTCKAAAAPKRKR